MSERTHTGPLGGCFRALDSQDYLSLEHAPSLKGLLRPFWPFKGKGDVTRWAQQCEALCDGLILLTRHRVLPQLARYPFDSLGIELAQHTTRSGPTLWRWRKVDRSAMGVALWDGTILDPRTPAHVVPDLLRMEYQRLTANMQVSLTHILARQAHACAEKLAHADATYLARPMSPNTSEESP